MAQYTLSIYRPHSIEGTMLWSAVSVDEARIAQSGRSMLHLGYGKVERGFCERLIVLEVASRAIFDNNVYDVMSFVLHVGIVCNLFGHYE